MATKSTTRDDKKASDIQIGDTVETYDGVYTDGEVTGITDDRVIVDFGSSFDGDKQRIKPELLAVTEKASNTFTEGDILRVNPEFGDTRVLRVDTVSTYDDSIVLRNNVGEARYLRRVDGRRYIHSGAALGPGGFKRSKAIRVESVEVGR
jgi:hypothetical protein